MSAGSASPPAEKACPRCGRMHPERLLVGGLCPICVARSVQTDLLSLTDDDLPDKMEEKEPVSLQVRGYQMRELIGGGVMGEVYRGIMTAQGREVALKMVAGRLTRDPEVMARFDDEVRKLQRMNHPNVVRVLAHDEMANGRHFLVTEYVEGCDLQRLLRADRLEPARALDIFVKTCAGVAHAHELGVIHRDIKPANILVGRDGTVKVADFGVAKLLVDTSMWYGFTQERDGIAQSAYSAPEVVKRGEKGDQRVDVYSLGILLEELLTGSVPYRGAPSLSARTGLDKRLDAIVAAATATDPQDRTPRVELLMEAVLAVEKGLRRGKLRWSTAATLAGVGVLLAAGVGGGVWMARNGFAPGSLLSSPAGATQSRPWTNSLGMVFVPVPGTGVLFAVHETRVRDFRKYAKMDSAVLPDWRAGGAAVPAGAGASAPAAATAEGLDWQNPGPGFEGQTPDHPVCVVSLVDARLFCAWLTWKERLEGRISDQHRYRLPTDEEWSRAALMPTGGKADTLLIEPDADAQANLAGPEAAEEKLWPPERSTLLRRDPFPRTAPVGSFPPNPLGIHDLTGNVSEWTDTLATAEAGGADAEVRYILRGGSWATGSARSAHPSAHPSEAPDTARRMYGFRVVLELQSQPGRLPRE